VVQKLLQFVLAALAAGGCFGQNAAFSNVAPSKSMVHLSKPVCLHFYVSQLAILPQVNLNRTRPIFILQGFLLILQGLKFQSLYSPLQSLKSPFQSQH